MTTIKQFTDTNITGATCSIDLKIIKARAASEHLTQVSNALSKDAATIRQLCTLLGVNSVEAALEYIPTTDALAKADVLHESYINLVLRTLLRSDSPETSSMIRSRFAQADYLVNLGSVQGDALKDMRAKYINLLEIHGAVKLPNLWERFVIKMQGWFARAPQST